jgi:hypothetical protein
MPVITIGGIAATVTFAGLVAPGEFQFNVIVPSNVPDGDNALVASYRGATTSGGHGSHSSALTGRRRRCLNCRDGDEEL